MWRSGSQGWFASWMVWMLVVAFGGTARAVAAPGPPTIPVRSDPMNVYQDSLRSFGIAMYQHPAEPERLRANYAFIRTLVSALKQPHSFEFGFDSLKMISILQAPDRSFRIFSWHLALSDGSYLYYGAIQLRTEDGSLKLYPLHDKTYEIDDPDRAIVLSDQWYGAQYYELIPFEGSYLLLGWKGHNPRIAQRVIDVLTIDPDGDRAVFGKAIFVGNGYDDRSRIIFRFAGGLSMHLSYQPDAKRIIFDHLVPSDPRHQGDFAYYGPDLTFDAWILEPKKLRLIEETDYQ